MSLTHTGSAPAATLDIRGEFGGSVTYIAGEGEQNDVVMTGDRFQGEWRVFVNDSGPLDLGEGCEANDTGAVCTASQRPEVYVDMGDKNDSFDGAALGDGTRRGTFELRVDAREGRDDLLALAAHSCLYGQEGADRIELADFVSAPLGSCVNFGGEGDDLMVGSDRRDFLDAGAGRDRLEGRGGEDELTGYTEGDVLRGGAGPDELIPGQGGDQVNGGEGSDDLVVEYRRPGNTDGQDELSGDSGNDSALYLCGGCDLSLDGRANDGLPGESDNLDVEAVTIQSKSISDEIPTVYGPGHDRLVGGPGDEELSTKRGEDELVGGRGSDTLDAGKDDDEVRAADGERDEVICGPGRDVASVDQFDEASGCEVVAEVISD